MALFRILSDVTGSRKSKMAAIKLEILISRLLDKIATPFQRLTPIFGVQQLSATITNTVLCNRKSIFQDGGRQTGSKPEVLISQLLDKIATPFQRLTPIFGVQQLNGAIVNTVRCNRKSVFKDGGR